MLATGTATDPLALSAEDARTVPAGGATGTRTVRASLLGDQVTWGSPNFGDPFYLLQGPSFEVPDAVTPFNAPDGPVTLSLVFTMMRACNLTGFRFYKAPALTGTIQYALWNAAGTSQATGTFAVTADAGGWVEVEFAAPHAVTAAKYMLGVFMPGSDYGYSPWIYNGQDRVAYPFTVQSYTSNSSPTGSGLATGGSAPTFPTTFRPASYFIDPIAEWTDDLPGYSGGTAYFDQFVESPLANNAFPVGVFFADPPNLAGYVARGVNTLIAGSASDAYVNAVKAAGMDWWPTIHGGDMGAPVVVQEDTALAALVRGYHLTDEPDLFSTPYSPPVTVKAWRDACRLRDSTRPIFLDLSRFTVQNQGFAMQPPFAGITAWNQSWRDYAALADVLACDMYSLAASDSFDQGAQPGSANRYGLWTYPAQIRRMRNLNDGRTPVWGIVESTSQVPGAPTPEQVRRAVWAQLIAGARGIVFFDHRFGDSDVTQDFATILTNDAMGDMVQELSTLLQAIAPALHAADEVAVIESAVGTGTLAADQGGYAAGALIPIHHATRVADGNSYVFAQSIRAGIAGTVTFTAPSLAGDELTVIGEGRTVTVDGSGVWTDTFTGDYAVHLYTTGDEPTFVVPANTVAPALSTDGTPQTGETISTSTGTWTGVPTPTYAYQWQRDGGNISGATASSYALQVADEGTSVRCRVTATNSQGSASVNSNAVTPTAPTPGASDYASAVLADNPVAYWRLSDYTDETGNGHTLTAAGTVHDAASLLDAEPDATGAKGFVFADGSILSAADTSDLNPTAAMAWEAWTIPQFDELAILGKGGHMLVTHSSKFRAELDAASNVVMDSTTNWVAGERYHVVMTTDGSTSRLFVNGVEEASVAFGITLAAQTGLAFLIGDSPHPSFFNFTGTIDEVAVYDHDLSAARVLAHFEAGTVGGGVGELPPGVTLTAIDGGPTYYADEGLTRPAARGWDDLSFFPIGLWLAPLQSGDYARWHDLALNTAFGLAAPLSSNFAAIRTEGFSLVAQAAEAGSFTGIGAETVGLAIDEPSTTSEINTPFAGVANTFQDNRFWWVNFTWTWLVFEDLDGVAAPTVMSAARPTPNATTREIDVQSHDFYWCSGTLLGDALDNGGSIYGLGRPMTVDELRRPCHYGYALALQRAFADKPIFGYVENGGPWLENTTAASYIQPDEINAAVWACIIGGARGIIYFNHTFAGPADTNDNLADPYYQTVQSGQSISVYDQTKATNELVTSLAVELNSPRADDFVTVSPAASTFAGIDVRATYREDNGVFTIIALPRTSEAATSIAATFTTEGGYSGPVTVVGESRTVTATAGVFSDTFATGTTVHIYQFSL